MKYEGEHNIGRRKFLKSSAMFLSGILLAPMNLNLYAGNEPNITPSQPSQLNGRIDSGYTEYERQLLDGMVDEQYERILALGKEDKLPLRDMVNTIVPYESDIRNKSSEYGVPYYLAIGIAVLENGGGTDKTSRAGCRGVMQLCKDVAKEYGVIRLETITTTAGKGKKKHLVKKKVWVDYRGNPIKNIDAGLHYFSDLYHNDFHDWGFSIQAYHAGPKRVKQGLSKYIWATKRKGINWKEIDPEVLQKYNANWIKMMQNRAAFRHFQLLNDETEYYLPKALACWRIYNNRKEIFESMNEVK